MAYEISEALYAGVSTLENLGAYTSPEVFTDLYDTVLDGLKGAKVYGSEKNGTSDALKKGFLGAIKGKGEGYLYDDLAGAISAVQATRSAIGMHQMWLDIEKKEQFLLGPVVLIGSAPSALMTLLDLIQEGMTKPSLIIGMPVGFIGVSECKTRLLNSDCLHIVLEGSKGGASLAAATVNALLRAAEY